MKALMTNSTQPNILVAKMRDQGYVKHLRQVQKINNRQAFTLRSQLKDYHNIADSLQKNRRKNRQFNILQHKNVIQKKNELIQDKIKNIRSMFNFKNLKKSQKRAQSVLLQRQLTDMHSPLPSQRYNPQNTQLDELNKISQQISNNIINGQSIIQNSNKKNRVSRHYYLRKRQQQLINHENIKLINGILQQRSVYSSPNKNKSLQSLKLPSVKTARNNKNQNQQSELHSSINRYADQKEQNNKLLMESKNNKLSESKQQNK